MQKYTHIKKNWFCTTNNCSLIEIKDNKKTVNEQLFSEWDQKWYENVPERK